jgi:hypothetical protein
MRKPIFIGFFATGGIGSHPGIVTQSELEKLHPDYCFNETEELEEVPEALLCIFDEDILWDIRGISNELAQKIIDSGGSDFYYEGDEGFKEACELAVLRGDSPVQVAVIKNVDLNTIYYSHNPEGSHGYWEPDTENITVEEFSTGEY